jgi:hypothetical protein
VQICFMEQALQACAGVRYRELSVLHGRKQCASGVVRLGTPKHRKENLTVGIDHFSGIGGCPVYVL